MSAANRALLALEGAIAPFSAAYVTTGGVERARRAAGNEALERGLTIVREVLGERSLLELDAIAVSIGPGQYTSLRIALAYAKAFALAANAPLIAVSSFDVVEQDASSEPSAAFVAGKKGFVHARLRRRGRTLLHSGPEEAVADALAGRLAGHEVTTWGAPQGVLARLGERGVIVRSHRDEVPPALALGRRALALQAARTAHGVRADYGDAQAP